MMILSSAGLWGVSYNLAVAKDFNLLMNVAGFVNGMVQDQQIPQLDKLDIKLLGGLATNDKLKDKLRAV